MPTKRDYTLDDVIAAWKEGFADGRRVEGGTNLGFRDELSQGPRRRSTRPKRKLSAWNKYVKANSNKPRFRYRNGKLNLKKMAVAFRKTPAGRKKRR